MPTSWERNADRCMALAMRTPLMPSLPERSAGCRRDVGGEVREYRRVLLSPLGRVRLVSVVRKSLPRMFSPEKSSWRPPR